MNDPKPVDEQMLDELKALREEVKALKQELASHRNVTIAIGVPVPTPYPVFIQQPVYVPTYVPQYPYGPWSHGIGVGNVTYCVNDRGRNS